MSDQVGVRRVTIADVCPGLDDTVIIGVIIASQNTRMITMKKDLSQRGVWNFTFRDSEADFINVTVWGSPTFIEICADEFHIGDVVSITKARITFRVIGGNDDNFRPSVSSQFQLTLSEGTSEIQRYDYPDAQRFQNLCHVPTKESYVVVPLRDVGSNGGIMQDSFIDLLVAVQNVQRVRQIKTSDGRQTECCDVTVFDRSSSGLSVQLWDKEIIYQASSWKPRETILFMADIKMKWSGFHKAYIPSINSKTVITVDPQTPDAECLRVYARAAPLQPTAIIDYLTSNIVDASSIQNVMSVRAVMSRAWVDLNNTVSNDEQQFTALVYALVTHFDVDHENIVQTKCSSCNKVASIENACSNPDCPVEQGTEVFAPQRNFNIRINLSDHTGTLKNCRLTAETAEAVLGCSVLQFDTLTEEQKTTLKWNFLLQRCAVRILVLKASHERRQPYISIVSCTVADLAEVNSRLPLL